MARGRSKNDGMGRLGGRKLGTKNKKTEAFMEGFTQIYNNNIGCVQEHLDALAKAEEHDKWLSYFFQLANFVVPKIQAIKVSEASSGIDFASEINKTIYKEEEDI